MIDIKTTVVNVTHAELFNFNYYDIYIGRGSKWGNPFYIERDNYGCEIKGSRKKTIEQFKEWIITQKFLMNSLHELKGKRLGCFCAPWPCHGDVLIELIEEML